MVVSPPPLSLLDIPPSFCDMGNAITSLIGQVAGEDQGEGDECVLLSEEHSLVLTCCWVSLKVLFILPINTRTDHPAAHSNPCSAPLRNTFWPSITIVVFLFRK